MVPSLVVQVHLQLSHDLLLLNMHQLCTVLKWRDTDPLTSSRSNDSKHSSIMALPTLCQRLKLLYSLNITAVQNEEDTVPGLQPGTLGNKVHTQDGNQDSSSTTPASPPTSPPVLPLVMVLSEGIPQDIIECLVAILKRGGTLLVEPYKLLLPKRNKNELYQQVQLMCVGFDSSSLQFGLKETHTPAQERRNLYSFLQSISIDGTTQEGGHIWSWYNDDEDDGGLGVDGNGHGLGARNDHLSGMPVPSPSNPSGMLDVCMKKKIISRIFFRHDTHARNQLDIKWSEEWSPIHITEQLSVQACGYLGPEISCTFVVLILNTWNNGCSFQMTRMYWSISCVLFSMSFFQFFFYFSFHSHTHYSIF
jgi:hypothetical protein